MNPARRNRETRGSMGMSGHGAGPGWLGGQPDHHQANEHEPRPAVIVVGSTTTALLVEALAQAGMLRCGAFPDDFPCHRATVRRAATWAEAAELAGSHAPCVAVTTGSESGPALRDGSGEPVRTTESEALLARSQQVPPQRTGSRRWLGALATSAPLTPGWLRALIGYIQPLTLSRPARRQA